MSVKRFLLFWRRPAKSLDCRAVVEALQFYLDGAVDPQQAELIAAHLDYCRKCGLEAETYQHIKTTLADQQTPVSPEAVERLRAFGQTLLDGQ